jgi:predicted transcriptional regulator
MKKRIQAVVLASKSQIKEVEEEDLEVSAELPSKLKQTEGKINMELEQLEKLIVAKDKEADEISDLHSVQEDSDEDPHAFVHS